MDKTGITVFGRFSSLLCSVPVYEIKTNDGNNSFFELDNNKSEVKIKMYTNSELSIPIVFNIILYVVKIVYTNIGSYA